MYKYSPTLWSIWPYLPFSNRLFVLILASVAIYSILSAIKVMKGLHQIASGRQSTEAADPVQPSFNTLHARCSNLREILGSTFYLFGFVFFIGLQRAWITEGDGRGFPIVGIMENFAFQFVFAANIFCVLLALHVVQWFVSSRLQSCARRLGD